MRSDAAEAEVRRPPDVRSTTEVRQERARRRHRPRRVQVLVVAESPPASGRFFYHGDSGLYRAVRDAFTAAQPPQNGQSFLESFRRSGWYLVDLCSTPVNHLDRHARITAHDRGVPRLARTVRRLHPRAIVVVVRMVGPRVRRAIQLADWTGTYVELPYPGRWAAARRDFAAQFRTFLSGGCVDGHDASTGSATAIHRAGEVIVSTGSGRSSVRLGGASPRTLEPYGCESR